MVDVPVNPDVLIWAREERRLSRVDAAALLGISDADLENFETGLIVPSLGLVRKIAAKYEITFASLLMPSPLPDDTRPKVDDFRTHLGQGPRWSHELAVALDNINELIDALVDLRDTASDLFPTPNLPRVRSGDDVRPIAANERERIGVGLDEQFNWETERIAFNRWRAAIEAQGVFTYTEKLGEPADCKGFTIFDERQIPVLVINSEAGDYAPRTFTLLHEYAHLLLRQAGVSDENPNNSTERFCNQFAAYIAMPAEHFRPVAIALRGANQEGWSDHVIGELAKTFKVSRTAIVLHLEDMALAPSGFYQTKMREWFLFGRRPRRGGLSTHAGRVTNRLGVRHVRVVLDALDSGRINKLDANELLNVRPDHFEALREEIRDRQMHYGGDT